MNTVLTGETFEKKVYEKFNKLLENNQLHVNNTLSKVHFKPSYYSVARKKNIIFDVSIETKHFNKDDISLLTIIECKKYNKKVPVDDVEEFIKKLDQVSGKNIKGILCSTIGFQQSCLEVARYYKVALVRISPNNDIHWDLCRKQSKNCDNKHDKKVERTLIDETINIPEDFFASFYNGNYTYSIYDLLQEIMHHDVLPIQKEFCNITIPFISKEDINTIVFNDLKERKIFYNKTDYYKTFIQYIGEIKKSIEIIDNCDLGVDSTNNIVIGKCTNNKIYTTDIENFNNVRYNFTLAHELGHLLLHSNSEWYKTFTENYCDIEIENLYRKKTPGYIQQIESQANLFAAELLVPDNLFIKSMSFIIKKLNLVDKGFGIVYLDHQRGNRILLNNVIAELFKTFRVSKSVLEIKLKQLGYLKIKYESNTNISINSFFEIKTNDQG